MEQTTSGTTATSAASGTPRAGSLAEWSGAFGDLGTLVPFPLGTSRW
jgi:hypothetical protein